MEYLGSILYLLLLEKGRRRLLYRGQKEKEVIENGGDMDCRMTLVENFFFEIRGNNINFEGEQEVVPESQNCLW